MRRTVLKKIKIRMKDMKQRIIALVLVVVMALLSMTSCAGSFNFAEEDLSKYAEFDAKAFKEALLKLEIEDGDYTTDDTIRAQKVLEKIYDTIADAIVKSAYESDRKTEGDLGKGDVLYFVYYAVDEKTNNVYFLSDMRESAITANATKANHVINLGHVSDENDFMTLIKENIAEGDLKDYVYSTITAEEIKTQVKEETLKANDKATDAEINAAVDAALKIKAGETIYISYTRTYTKVDAEGKESTVTETANYEKITLDPENGLHKIFLHEKASNKLGGNFSAYDEATDKTLVEFKYTEGDVEYTYSKVKLLFKVENEGKPIATFKHTPYTATQNVAPDSLTSGGKVDLKDVELTYYVYPVYALSAPACDEIDVLDVLVNLYGAKLTKTSFEAFEDDTYKNGDQKVADLIGEITKIYGKKDEAYYGEGKALKGFIDALNKANEAVKGDKATAAEQKVIDAATEALTKAQNEEAKKIFEKIIEAKNKDNKVLGEVIYEEYTEDIRHTLKEAYDGEIVKNVQKALWDLIEKSVKVVDYPQDVIDEYYEVLYESYEHEFHTGKTGSTSNFKKYDGSFEKYLIATLKVKTAAEIEGAIIKEVKSYVEPIIKIFVVAKALEADASAKLGEYVEADIKTDVYKDDQESIDRAREEAKYFIINDSYLKYYKKEVGRAYYRNLIDSYGEINLRAGLQFNKLFGYLTSANIVMTEDGDHSHAEYKYTEKDAEGNIYLDFRTIKYVIVEPADDAETDTETGTEGDHDHEH